MFSYGDLFFWLQIFEITSTKWSELFAANGGDKAVMGNVSYVFFAYHESFEKNQMNFAMCRLFFRLFTVIKEQGESIPDKTSTLDLN